MNMFITLATNSAVGNSLGSLRLRYWMLDLKLLLLQKAQSFQARAQNHCQAAGAHATSNQAHLVCEAQTNHVVRLKSMTAHNLLRGDKPWRAHLQIEGSGCINVCVRDK